MLKCLFNLSVAVFCSVTLSVCLQPFAQAQDSIGSSIDCTNIEIPYSENADLTRAERLALMDQAFFGSLEQFDLCQSTRNNRNASGASGGGGGGGSGASGGGGAGDASGAEGSDNTNETLESLASSGISGTEEPRETPVAEDIPDQGADPGHMERESPKYQTGRQTAGGELPDDIPSADNDDAFAAQVRYAAENERNPEKKARLWDEYRKYKGLPAKN
uniref:Secreted protein n=1 Tax=Candidatus Kentrum sp. FW TaxID=2126338 RepID=A0A450TPT0_9GAMM|nr:MAG: hypothetical protein BECKFW1821C_GA0114237_102024 [Candidatus Kentron sp. FW]